MSAKITDHEKAARRRAQRHRRSIADEVHHGRLHRSVTDDQIDAARLTCARYATDAGDLRMLLDMCGIGVAL